MTEHFQGAGDPGRDVSVRQRVKIASGIRAETT